MARDVESSGIQLLLLVLLKYAGRLLDVYDSWWRWHMYVCCSAVVPSLLWCCGNCCRSFVSNCHGDVLRSTTLSLATTVHDPCKACSSCQHMFGERRANFGNPNSVWHISHNVAVPQQHLL
jgi:hypothetical protein